MAVAEISKTEALKCEDVGKLFFRLAAPTTAAQAISLIYSLADRIYIGHMKAGISALAGVGVCLPLIIIISAFALFISAGAAPCASAFLGKGDKKSAEKILGGSIASIFFMSAALTAVFQLFSEELLFLFGATENTISYAKDYMLVYSMGTFFVELTLGLNAFIIIQGSLKSGIYALLVGAVINVILDPIFIFALDMGVKGAAAASVISYTASSICTIMFLTGSKSAINLKWRYLAPKYKFMFTGAVSGFAPFIIQATDGVILICYNSSLLKYGGDLAVGAMAVLTAVMQIVVIPLTGMAQGAQKLISFNYLSKEDERTRRAVKILISCSLMYSLFICALAEICPQVFVRIFSRDKALSSFTIPSLRIFMAASGFLGIQTALRQILASIGKVKDAYLVDTTRKIILSVPLIYIMPQLGLPVSKTTSVFMAQPATDVVSTVFALILFPSVLGKTLNSEEGAEAVLGKQSGYYRFLKNIVLLCTKPMETIWDVPFEGKPSVFVCNHDRAYGPIAMCAHFELSSDIRPWINAQVLSAKEAPAYIRQDYWWDADKWYAPVMDYTAAYACALILPPILRGSGCIPVYHDTGVISTLRQSVKMLSEGKHILLFPEHPTGYRTYGERIFDGFVSVGRLYYAKTKETVNFYPTYVDWENKVIRVGRPVAYDPEIKYEEMVRRTTAAVEEYFKKLGENEKR
ncbi:MAG: hypothetical protein GX488_04550 [Clostridiales bacterium]|nr:hypothetical protein [Clostridiales bacterium]